MGLGSTRSRRKRWTSSTPSTEQPFAKISIGAKADVDRAVAAAKRAFETFGYSEPAARLDLLHRIIAVYKRRSPELALAISREMGAPRAYALDAQVASGLGHLEKMAEVLKGFAFEERRGTSARREGAGRCRRHDHALELAPEPDRLQGRSGPCGRLHHGAEAERGGAARTLSCSPKSWTRPACRPACSTSSTVTDPGSARRSRPIPIST